MKPWLIVLLLMIFFSCSKKEVNPSGPVGQLFINTNMETGTNYPTGWWYNSNGTGAQFYWPSQAAYSGTHSIEISSSTNLANVVYWGQSITQDIPFGRDLILQVRIKGSHISGAGAGVAIACLNATSTMQAQQFATTQGTHSINGDFDWTSYRVDLAGVHRDITEIRVYLMLFQNGMGQVYFDDVTLTSH